MVAEKEKEHFSWKISIKKKHRIIGMQNNRFGIYTDCNGEIRRGRIMEGFLCYIKHPELLFCFFVLTRFHRSRMSICLLGTIIIYTHQLVFNINSSPFHSHKYCSLDRKMNIFQIILNQLSTALNFFFRENILGCSVKNAFEKIRR